MLPFECIVYGTPRSLQAKSASKNAWKIKVSEAANQAVNGQIHLTEQEVRLHYYYEGDSPDVDNIIKPIQDALIGVVYVDEKGTRRRQMGYDMHYRFDPSDEYDADKLLSRLVDAGAEIAKFDDGSGGIFFLCFGTWFIESPEHIARGDWLWSRMPPDEGFMLEFFEFAEKLGCTLFDPQSGEAITPLGIKEALADREAGQRRIASLLGATVGSGDKPNDH
jgi:hypothetical protein